MNKSKQLAVNMIASIIAYLVNILIGFFMSPYIVKNIGAEAYGFIGLAENFISYVTIVTIALNSMAGRFITIGIHKEEYEDVNAYYSSVIISNSVLSVIFGVVAIGILYNLSSLINVPYNLVCDVTVLWAFLFLNFFVNLIFNVFSIATYAYNRLDLSSLRNVEASLLKVIILLITFSIFKPHVWYIGLSTILCSSYIVCFNVYYTRKFMPYVKVNKKYFDLKKIKSLLSSGIWNSITKISSLLSTGLDLLIANLFVGPIAMGIVSIAKIIPSYVLSLFGIVSNTFSPQLTISYAKNDFEDIKKQLISAIRMLGFFAAIPVTCLWVFSCDFFALWMPSQDSEVLRSLTILSTLAFPFSLSLEPLWNIFTVTNRVKNSSLFLILNSFISIAVTYIFIINAGTDVEKMYIICGISSLLSVIRAITFLPIYGAKCLGFKWYTFYSIICKNLFSFIISMLFATLLKNILVVNGWLKLIFAVAATCVVVCFVNYFTMLTKFERKKILSLIMRRKQYDT